MLTSKLDCINFIYCDHGDDDDDDDVDQQTTPNHLCSHAIQPVAARGSTVRTGDNDK